MELTGGDIARIPRGNIRVPRAEFAAVWAAAERLGQTDWHAAGVCVTCRWLACAVVRPATGGRWYVAHAPATGSSRQAFEELIEAEAVAADRLQFRRSRPGWVATRAGWIDGVAASFRWAWWRTGPAPLQVPAYEAG